MENWEKVVLLICFVLILGVLILDCFSIYGILRIKSLQKLDIQEKEYAVINTVVDYPRGTDTTVYFLAEKDNKEYRVNLLEIFFDGNPNDRLQVIFNKSRTFMIFPDYIKASYGSYIANLIISLFGLFGGIQGFYIMLKK
jgi:hypothetical protein